MGLQVGRGWRSTQARLAETQAFCFLSSSPRREKTPDPWYFSRDPGREGEGWGRWPCLRHPPEPDCLETHPGRRGSGPACVPGAVVRSSELLVGPRGYGHRRPTCTRGRRAGCRVSCSLVGLSAACGSGPGFTGAIPHSGLNRSQRLFLWGLQRAVQHCDVKMAWVPETRT